MNAFDHEPRRSARIMSVATAVPPYVLDQDEVARRAELVFGPRFADFERLAGVFANSGIRKRHAVRPMEWFLEPKGWPERTAAYLECAADLFCEAAARAIERAGIEARDVDTIATVSSTGIATPSLEARVAPRMGFRDDVERVPVFGLGCAGGVSGLSIAERLARSRPGSHVLLVALELCTLAFRLDKLTSANVVATALFGDGAAACVVRVGEGGLAEIEMTAQMIWPHTLDIMGWSVENEGFGVIFDRSIPPFAAEHFGPAIAAMLARSNLTLAEIDRFICHPGGAKVIAALEEAMALDEGVLDIERSVLADYGNMSGPTVLFVLERAIAAGLPSRSVMTALGPGFTASCATLRTGT